MPRVPENVRTVGADGKQRHGDAAIALALALYAVDKIDTGEIDYGSIGPTSGHRIAGEFTGVRAGLTDDGFGTVSGANVTNIAVNCATGTFYAITTTSNPAGGGTATCTASITPAIGRPNLTGLSPAAWLKP